MKPSHVWALVAFAAVFRAQDVVFEEAPPKKKSSQQLVTQSIRKVRFASYPEVTTQFDEVIEYVLERADNFNILGDEELIQGHVGKFGTRLHIPRNPWLRRRGRRHRRRRQARHLKAKAPEAHPRKMMDLGTDEAETPKKNSHAMSGRVLSEKSGPENPKVKKMFSQIFGSMKKLKKETKHPGFGAQKRPKKKARKTMGMPGGGGGAVSSAAASPQINDSRIIVHSFAAPAVAPQSYVKAPYSDTSPQVIQTRMQLH